jgi:short-subunit dehydrogenase
MKKLNFRNRWVLVTGASSGLGREMALILALQEEANLLITARRIQELSLLKEEIVRQKAVQVEIIQADLSQNDGVEKLFQKATAIAPVYALINNAGITFYGKTKQEYMLFYEKIVQINFMATMKLNLMFAPYFMGKGEGAILNVTSHGAFIPMPYQNVYAASKSACQFFCEALREEIRKSGVVVCQYAPGGIYTEMFSKSGLDKHIPRNNLFMMDAQVAARKAIRAFKNKKVLAITGWVYKVIHFIIRFFPRRWVVRVAGKIYRPRNPESGNL